MKLNHWILDENMELVECDLMTWAKWLESKEGRKCKIIGHTAFAEAYVSTVFLGLDHNFSREGDPILFETMVFEHNETEIDVFGKIRSIHKPIEDYTERYRTLDEARKGHFRTCIQVKKEGTFWKCEICEEMRPNSKIAVYSYALRENVSMVRNLKYCTDKRTCFDGAVEKSLTGKI